MQQDAAEHFGTGLNLGRLCFRAELKPRPRRECAHRHPQSRVPQLVHRECPLPRHATGCCIGLVKPCKLGGFRRGAGGQGKNWPAMIKAANRLKGLRMKAELSTSPTEPCLALLPEDNAAIPTTRCHNTTQRFLDHTMHEAHVSLIAALPKLQQTVVTSRQKHIMCAH